MRLCVALAVVLSAGFCHAEDLLTLRVQHAIAKGYASLKKEVPVKVEPKEKEKPVKKYDPYEGFQPTNQWQWDENRGVWWRRIDTSESPSYFGPAGPSRVLPRFRSLSGGC